MKVLIMAGGAGTRFWPRSTAKLPKQFLALTSERTMLQETYQRFVHRLPITSVYVVTTKQYVELVTNQLPDILPEQLIIEPERRDTAPCIALSALRFLQEDDNEVLVTTPADQYIREDNALWSALKKAEHIAKTGERIVTLGITPTRPETGYGYIETAPADETSEGLPVKSFIEKPNEATARQLMRQPNVYWNSGIFIWKPSTIAYYMAIHQPQLWDSLVHFEEHSYRLLPKISIDYAILEKADSIYMIPVAFEWDDVGAWSSLERIYAADGNGNISIGNNHIADSKNCIIYSELNKTILIGVKDLIVVSTIDGLLVCHKSYESSIKHVLAESEI